MQHRIWKTQKLKPQGISLMCSVPLGCWQEPVLAAGSRCGCTARTALWPGSWASMTMDTCRCTRRGREWSLCTLMATPSTCWGTSSCPSTDSPPGALERCPLNLLQVGRGTESLRFFSFWFSALCLPWVASAAERRWWSHSWRPLFFSLTSEHASAAALCKDLFFARSLIAMEYLWWTELSLHLHPVLERLKWLNISFFCCFCLV